MLGRGRGHRDADGPNGSGARRRLAGRATLRRETNELSEFRRALANTDAGAREGGLPVITDVVDPI
jgi:hypothetical protein